MPARRVVACTIYFCAYAVWAGAQVPGQNVNMVAGTAWPGGDPFLQRQNEPSVAVSSRNPLHLLAGANDYRTVDLAGLLEAGATGDAWHGVFTSTDGGGRWTSTLLPGYPQDTSPEGLASPIHGLQAGADPFVRSAAYGLFFYGGLAFNRGDSQPSAIFVARYSDRNDREAGDPFAYEGTFVVARNRPGEFLDKPAFAVGLPAAGGSGTCLVNGVRVPAPYVYAAWTVFVTVAHPHQDPKKGDAGEESEQLSYMVVSRSLDCGETWSTPIKFSGVGKNQSATIAVDPHNPNNVYVAWRSFGDLPGDPGKIWVMKSKDAGRSFNPPAPIASFHPFDQGTTGTSFRTNSYPTMAVDESGRVYVAWAARGYAPGNGDPIDGDARIVMTSATDGGHFSMPRAVDNFPGPGHQIMPALTYGGGRLQLVYYDLREDISGFFERFVDELTVFQAPIPRRRHTLDVRAAQALPGAAPAFASYSVLDPRPSFQASRYLFGVRAGEPGLQQLQFNPPNLPLYALGTLPFIGDYIDVATQTFVAVRNADGTERWRFNTNGNPVFHAVWTDNRDVVQPADGNWQNYTPPSVTLGGTASRFDPMLQVPACIPGQGGMRNANIYTSRITSGLAAGSPGNAKPLSTALQRAFVVFAQNTTEAHAAYRLRILDQPAGGHASFLQFDALPGTAAYDVHVAIEPVIIGARSSVARTVYVTSTDPRAQVRVEIVQVAAGGVPGPPPEGRGALVILNPDIGNPDIGNPDIGNPDIGNPDIGNAEVQNPDIGNPDIGNPDIGNPDIGNPDIGNPDIGNTAIANPDIGNPDIGNPDIGNVDISNPDIGNPDIGNPDIGNGSITDYSYEVTETGNTASQVELDLATAIDPMVLQQAGVHVQVLVHREYQTPALALTGCAVNLVTQDQFLGNFANPFTPLAQVGVIDPLDGALNNMTFWLAPGERLKVTIRVIDEDTGDTITFNPTQDAVIAVTAATVSTNLPPGSAPESGVQAPIVAVGDAYEAATGGTLDVPAPGVRGNDTVRSGFLVTALLAAGPAHASEFSLSADGGFTYVAEEGFAGQDSFAYALAFGAAASNVATVTIQVTRVKDGDPLVVTNTNDSGIGSLRYAIEWSNASPNPSGPNVVTFAIQGEDATRRITPATLLPAITQPIVLDGSTQPGYQGTPVVVIDGSGIDPGPVDGGYGLAIGAGPSTVRALAIVNTPGKGLILTGGGGNVVQGNWIGVDPPSGAAAPTREAGIAIMNGSSGNTIGVTCPLEGPCTGANLVSGNLGAGVQVYDGNSNAIRGNRIGTTADGLDALPNAEGIGISEGQNNVIGGVRAGEGNVISGNLGAGVAVRLVESQPAGTVMAGNVIGIGAAGGALGNGGDGILLRDVSGVLVGGELVGARNVIGGNANGVRIAGAGGNTVLANFIGISPDGVEDRGNTQNGVLVESADNVVRANVISRNGRSGVRLLGSGAQGNAIQGNLIGTDAHGSIDTFVVGNTSAGVTIAGGSGNLVGGLGAGEGNVIADNDDKGVSMFAMEAGGDPIVPVGNRVLGNSVYANTGIGIDLGDDGETQNDGPGDEDFGANRLQNHPLVTYSPAEAGVAATVTLTSSFGRSFTVQLFITRGGCGGPPTRLETRTVQTNSDGNVSFTRIVPLSQGDGLWATATDDATGDTSEMRCARLVTN